MLPAKVTCPLSGCGSRPTSVKVMAFYTVLLLLFASVAFVHSTTLKHELHIGHNVDNRSPEIDPFWYVGRGVRPIGRFGKRQSSSVGRGLQSLANHLKLLLRNIRGKELQSLAETIAGEDADWLP